MLSYFKDAVSFTQTIYVYHSSVCTCAHSLVTAEKERNKMITTGSQISSFSLALVRKAKQNLSRVHFIIIIIIIIIIIFIIIIIIISFIIILTIM